MEQYQGLLGCLTLQCVQGKYDGGMVNLNGSMVHLFHTIYRE